MKFVAKLAAVTALVLAWGQVSYIRGFDAGADTSLCVGIAMLEHKSAAEIPACLRIQANDPYFAGVRAWRKLSGDAVV